MVIQRKRIIHHDIMDDEESLICLSFLNNQEYDHYEKGGYDEIHKIEYLTDFPID
jgi:hypothetical protein